MLLLADYSAGEAGGLLGAAVALTALAMKLGDWVKGWKQQSRENKRQDESETLTRMEAMLDRVERNLKDSEKENRRLRDLIDSIRTTAEREMEKCRQEAHLAAVGYARAVVWIKNVETFLRSKNINDFAPWTEAPEYGPIIPHSAAPETDIDDTGGV
jgi:hypothetical protein